MIDDVADNFVPLVPRSLTTPFFSPTTKEWTCVRAVGSTWRDFSRRAALDWAVSARSNAAPWTDTRTTREGGDSPWWCYFQYRRIGEPHLVHSTHKSAFLARGWWKGGRIREEKRSIAAVRFCGIRGALCGCVLLTVDDTGLSARGTLGIEFYILVINYIWFLINYRVGNNCAVTFFSC